MTARRSAFTLLEVLLTLAMSVALMLLIGGAMQFYGRTMNVREMDIQQTQLAAAILQMIEDDLRATIYTRPVDTAGLEALLAANSGQQLAPTGNLSAAGIDADAVEDDIPMNSGVLQSPGLIGNQFQVQVDVSRLPRLEEYVAMLDGTTANLDDIPSDIKTVAYFVQASGAIGGVADGLSTVAQSTAPASTGGLIRRSLDRAASVEATLTGGVSRLNQTGDLIAPEVMEMEFAYWDGITWLQNWNSDQFGELPLAVQVHLTIRDDIAASASQAIESGAPQGRVFQHIIRLPLARPIDASEVEASEETGL